MCRHLAYLGPQVPLSRVLLDPPHSLERQAWAPRDMRGGGTINADGFGVGWYPTPGGDGARYRRSCPIWADGSLRDLARATRSAAVLAAVRSATAGMPVVETACAPFAEGRWLFSHNGVVRGWPGSVADLAAGLPTEDLITLDAPTDAALLWALVRHRLRSGKAGAEVLAGVVADVAALAPGSRLNLLLTDGESVTATTWGHSLCTRRSPGALAVSSEPWDPSDPSWQAVPDRHVLHATRTTFELHPIDDKGRP
jgi:gamma-glutamyl hercynylcysteine S-oxide hydrolase